MLDRGFELSGSSSEAMLYRRGELMESVKSCWGRCGVVGVAEDEVTPGTTAHEPLVLSEESFSALVSTSVMVGAMNN